MLKGVTGLVPHDAHAFGARRTLHVEKLRSLQSPKAGMREVERHGESRNAARREPLVGQPDVRLQPQAACVELIIEFLDAALEPGPRNRDPKVLEAQPEKALVGETFPANAIG